ncbi:MAG: hypothetical protein ACREJ2_12325 [Planctomycetota bacterium]
MSMVARVFIIANLVLAAFVLALAFSIYGKDADWQFKYERERLTNIALKDHHVREVIRLNAQVLEAEAAREAMVYNLGKQADQIKGLEVQIKTTQQEMRTREALVFSLTTEVSQMANENSRLGIVINSRNQVISKLSDALSVSRGNEANMQEENASTQMSNQDLSQQVTALENQTARLQDQLATADQKIQVLVALLGRQLPAEATPKIDTDVQSVDNTSQTVVLGAGSDNGVKPGYTFSIFRGNSMIGQVKVQQVDQRMSVATYDGPLVTPNMPPQVGDKATTHLLGQ